MQKNNETIQRQLQPKTETKFKLQLAIVRKIIVKSLWIGRNTFPEVLIYEVSSFVFRNPLAFKYPVYRLSLSRELRLNQTFVLRQHIPLLISNAKKQNNGKSTQGSALLTIAKEWRPIQLSEQNYNEVLQRGRHFCNFLSNIKLYSLSPNQPDAEVDPLKDYGNYQKKQKQKSKYHYLISDNREVTYKSLEQIWRYEKDKKINMVVIKSFIYLMSKRIAVVKVEQNYCCSTLGCEGKYLYFQNQFRLPLAPGNCSQQKSWPWLEVDRIKDMWVVGKVQRSGNLLLYKEVTFPFTRRKQSLITRTLQQLQQDDVWFYSSSDTVL